MIVDRKLKCNKFETRNTKYEQVRVIVDGKLTAIAVYNNRTTNFKQGILSNSSLMARRRTTNLKQEILSNNWLGVFVDGKLKSNKLETRNIQ